MGWRLEEDEQCVPCGLAEWDGKFTVCSERNQFNECGCDDDCEEKEQGGGARMSEQQQKDMLTRLDEQIEFFNARADFSYAEFSEECKKEIEQLRQQLEEAERDRDAFAGGLLIAVFYSKCPVCGEYIDSGLHHPYCKYTEVIARARTIVYRQQSQGGEDEQPI